jgi:hypothetical protein
VSRLKSLTPLQITKMSWQKRKQYIFSKTNIPQRSIHVMEICRFSNCF